MHLSNATAEPRTGHQILLLLGTVLLVNIAQMTLGPIMSPLARDLGFAEWQVGVTVSSAALMVVLTSQAWGRRAQATGFRPVLVLGLAMALVAMTLFSVVAALGLAGVLVGWGLFILFLLFRGMGFGVAMAAVPPTAQAYIAEATDEGPERVKGMAGVGAMQGLASIVGAVIGGILAGWGLMWPISVAPVLLAISLGAVVWGFRALPRVEQVEQPRPLNPLDRRVWPFLVAGFGLFLALGFIQVTAGFLVQDRLHLGSEMTGRTTGMLMLAMGLGMVAAQAGLVPRLKWPPSMLLRWGVAAAMLGFILLLPDQGAWLMVVAFALLGLGLGLAIPGYMAGPTMLVERDEQGGLAGAVGATNGVTYVLSPLVSTLLYGWWQLLPVLVATGLLLAVMVFLLVHPAFRRPTPTADG